MRKRFEQQLEIGMLLDEDTVIPLKCRDSLIDLLAALKEIFTNEEYNEQIFRILFMLLLKYFFSLNQIQKTYLGKFGTLYLKNQTH